MDREYIIATASTADLPLAYCKEHQVPFVSYTYTIDEEEYKDDLTDESREALFSAMRAGKLPKTAAISTEEYYQFFEGLMDSGKDVLYTDMSRAVSSSIYHAEEAADRIKKEYPDRRFVFLDSFCITGGLGLLVKQLVQRHEAGESLEAVAAWGEAHKYEYIHRFMVEDLQWLKRGGRLSNISALVGTMLSVKPMIYIPQDGRLISYGMVRGRKKCFKALIASMEKDLDEKSPLEEITVIEADDRKDAEKFIRMIRDAYPQLEHANITITTLGPVIASHVGPDFIGLVYRGKGRTN